MELLKELGVLRTSLKNLEKTLEAKVYLLDDQIAKIDLLKTKSKRRKIEKKIFAIINI